MTCGKTVVEKLDHIKVSFLLFKSIQREIMRTERPVVEGIKRAGRK